MWQHQCVSVDIVPGGSEVKRYGEKQAKENWNAIPDFEEVRVHKEGWIEIQLENFIW